MDYSITHRCHCKIASFFLVYDNRLIRTVTIRVLSDVLNE